jgi:hypothetical protein
MLAEVEKNEKFPALGVYNYNTKLEFFSFFLSQLLLAITLFPPSSPMSTYKNYYLVI